MHSVRNPRRTLPTNTPLHMCVVVQTKPSVAHILVIVSVGQIGKEGELSSAVG